MSMRGLIAALLWGLVGLASAATTTGVGAGAQQQDSIWPRVAAGMRLVDPEHPETVTWARHYAEDPLAFERLLARSEPFLWYIVEAVELREMPLEIALLPAVESGFLPAARSRARAQGLWQFVPATGTALGLTRNASYDARSDAIASTRAALNYLQTLNDQFDDWLLALAAYNVGRGHLVQALRKAAPSRQVWDLALPRETREHVPRLLGVALLIQQPQRFGVRLPAISNRHGGELIPLTQALDLEAAARAAGIDAELLALYNPGLLFAGNSRGQRQILLPAAEAARLRKALASGSFPPRPVPGMTRYPVAAGDSLWRIARRHGVSVQELCRWNQLNPKAVLRVGQGLDIPQRST
jgi:membrane-bound lytic murein transglycosylase D